MGEPMAIDGSTAGLEQSDYHLLTGQSQYSPPLQTQASESPVYSQGDTSDLIELIIQCIVACVIPGKKDKVSCLVHKLYNTTAATVTSTVMSPQISRTSFSDNNPVTISQLKAILQETLQKPVVVTPQRPSYVSVARQPATGPTGNVQIIPEHCTREL
jgi:hypothetical protein